LLLRRIAGGSSSVANGMKPDCAGGLYVINAGLSNNLAQVHDRVS
jgi:hypothetical protein